MPLSRVVVLVNDTTELAAAQAAGIDMCSVPPEMMVDPKFRDVAPTNTDSRVSGSWDRTHSRSWLSVYFAVER